MGCGRIELGSYDMMLATYEDNDIKVTRNCNCIELSTTTICRYGCVPSVPPSFPFP